MADMKIVGIWIQTQPMSAPVCGNLWTQGGLSDLDATMRQISVLTSFNESKGTGESSYSWRIRVGCEWEPNLLVTISLTCAAHPLSRMRSRLLHNRTLG